MSVPFDSPDAKQKKLWQIDQNMMCSVVGTCLSMEEARRIGRKFSARCDDETQLDSVIHSMLVRDCSTQNQISVYVNKVLNKKFSGLVRVFQNLQDSSAVVQNWQRLLKEGLIPGAYWAAISHTALTTEDRTRIFSDVHMLSHLVGSSNQSLIKRLVEYENSIKTLEARHGNSQRKMQQHLEEQETTIALLRQKTAELTSALRQRPAATAAQGSKHVCHQSKLRILRQRHKRLEDEKQELQTTADVRLRRLKDAGRKIKLLEQDLQSLEQIVQNLGCSEPAQKTDTLKDMSILYVGGLNTTSNAMKSFVRKLGGELVHHSGGAGKKELSDLPVLVANADAVIVPMDNVSHASALEVKRACKRLQRPFMPIKSSGLGALATALSQFHAG